MSMVEVREENTSFMTPSQVPECVVCFQPYEHELNIPRVLSCGHTFCEPCLSELHTSWQTSSSSRDRDDLQSGGVLRCPECNRRTKLPLGGQKFLPKNVALLRLLPTSSESPPIRKGIQNLQARKPIKSNARVKRVGNSQGGSTGEKFGVPCDLTSSTTNACAARIFHSSVFSSDLREDPGNWDVKAWILPQELICIKSSSDSRLLYGEIFQKQDWAGRRISVSLLRLEGRKVEGSKTLDGDDCQDKSPEAECSSRSREKSYEQLVLDVADGLDYETKIEISLLFRISSICHRVCKTFGLWMNGKQELYLVSEYPENGGELSWDVFKGCRTRYGSRDSSPRNSHAETLAELSLWKSTGRGELEVLTSLGVRLCELLLEVHAQGLILGLLSTECISFDQFDNMLLDTNTALKVRYRLQRNTRNSKKLTLGFKANRQNVIDEDSPCSSRDESGAAAAVNTADRCRLDAEPNGDTDIHNEEKCWEYMSPEVLALLTSNMRRSDGASSWVCAAEDAFPFADDGEACITSKADVWSLGCILLEMITGKSPHCGSDFQAVLRRVLDEQGKPSSFQGLEFLEHGCDTYSSLDLDHHVLQNLLQRCFQYDPKERANISEILHGLKKLQLAHLACSGTFARKHARDRGKSFEQKNWILCLPGVGVDDLLKYGEEAQAQKQETRTSTPEIREHNSEAPHVEVSGEIDTLEAEGEEDAMISEPLEACLMEFKGSLQGHRDDVTALITRGNYLLSGSFDKKVLVWSLEDRKLLKILEGHHTQVILALAMDLESMRCFSGDQLGLICAWRLDEDVETPLLASWQEHNDWRYTGVACLALSGDGILYSGSGDRTIKAWSSQSFQLRGTMEGHKALVSALVVDGELLYSGSWDGVIRVWWRNDNSPVAVLSTSDHMVGGVRSLFLSNNMLFAGHDDGSIQIWMDEEHLTAVRAHKMVVSSLCVEGRFLYSGSWDHSIKVWRIDEITSSPLPALEETCESGVSALASDGNNLYVATLKAVKVYSIFSARSASSSSAEAIEQEETG